jgi:hypothetical protein
MEKLKEVSNKVANAMREGKINHPYVLELLKEINNAFAYISELELDNFNKDKIINESIIRPTKIDIEKISLDKLMKFASFFNEASNAKCLIELAKKQRQQTSTDYFKNWINQKTTRP